VEEGRSRGERGEGETVPALAQPAGGVIAGSGHFPAK
jgi:hypothetical protein